MPVNVGIRLHSKTLEELAEEDDFYKVIQEIGKEFRGILKCNLIQLAEKLNVKPYNVPKILY